MLNRTPMRQSSWATAVVPILIVATLACGQQSEGERCDTRNGSLDCDNGLVCRVGSELSLPGDTTGVGLCCPPDGVEPNVDECRAGVAQPPPENLPDDAGVDPSQPNPDAGTP